MREKLKITLVILVVILCLEVSGCVLMEKAQSSKTAETTATTEAAGSVNAGFTMANTIPAETAKSEPDETDPSETESTGTNTEEPEPNDAHQESKPAVTAPQIDEGDLGDNGTDIG